MELAEKQRQFNAAMELYNSRKGYKLFGTAVSGEGLLQTFEGTGQVWLVPFKSVYDQLTGGTFAVETTRTQQ